MKAAPLLLIILLAACGGSNVAATTTREVELRQLATLTAPTATRPPLPTLPPPPTAAPFQLTAQADNRKVVATYEAARLAACTWVEAVYGRNGEVFDRNKSYAVMLSEVRALEGLADPSARRSIFGSTRDRQIVEMVTGCVG